MRGRRFFFSQIFHFCSRIVVIEKPNFEALRDYLEVTFIFMSLKKGSRVDNWKENTKRKKEKKG